MWRIFTALAVLAVALCPPAHAADWYETKGWAPIINNDVDAARARAMESALRQSLDLAGGSVTSVEDVVNGVITGQHIQWQSQGAIEHVELVRERINGQRIEITVRALVRPNVQSCSANDYKSGLVIAPFEVKHRDHLQHGQIHDMPAASSFRFTRLLGQHSQRLFIQHQLQGPQGFLAKYERNDTPALGEYARRVAREHNSQYVVAGVFNDLSAAPQNGVNLAFWRHPNYDRSYELTLFLFDGISGELKTRASVAGKSPWNFHYTEQVNVSSEQFWQSDFGTRLETSMRDLVRGLDETLGCEPLRGQVVAAQGEQVTINLGSKHQLQVGAELQVMHRGGFYDELGRYREQWQLNPAAFVVTEVFANSSRLQARDSTPIAGVQARDLVVISSNAQTEPNDRAPIPR
ncbi:flagellar assembly protein T N-terminal domain-containing protein [Aliidiomarina celeris]|uniref:flagellar assembly protein T N-terminal domain-containing protein n=1 Tax=Aliidiomarina celeris TaxID=2249428 RepID=UPI000DE97C5D|nr:flagellar assembly protein T N-terminal domain-containing protein [Aliidiomarina celeris]